MKDLVECHSGSEYAERPTALQWSGQRLEVIEILARWRIPNGKCFVVRASDGQAYELVYDELEDDWTIHPVGYMGSGKAPSKN